ncbi:bifunctional nitrate reductase/sulfite reductase flavoprotein subunit alpha [Pseudomonas frederiksbergensis]|uniref:Reductase n=1 Tax=Pseudomonas frederiksbergensis TaxID=104087 RepID=A0A423K7J6_9PSED|nr:bifunctional nitrate reductase/sulfite reductase flavoprotein subunit alpha [Pseudomonas frederiksbergensis]RON47728.1 reductase [Pseudomonas frederiksbergensis]
MTNTSVRSVCPYCGVGCGIVMQVADNRVIKVTGDKTHPSNFGRLCTKGTTCGQAIADSGRMENAFLRQERQRDPVRIGMDQAISETASQLRKILDQHGPDALAFYVSGQMSLEAQYLINKLAKGFVRTNNIESNSRLCMASASSGYKLSLGSDGPPGSYEDFDRADLFFVIGANMADCHPILFLRMMDRVKAGAKLIVVDPRRSATADKAGLFLPIKPGTDLALLNGLLHLLVKNGHTDPDFIAGFTEGWDVMPGFLDDYSPAIVAAITGLPEADIRQAARWIGEAAEWMSCWTMGLNQSTHGTWNTNALCNLHLATGAICRPGSGPFSLTGQPNAMGGREMGYMGPGLPGQRSVLVEEDRQFIENLWGIPHDSLPRNVGGGTVAMFEQMRTGQIKACWIICTNPVASAPNRQSVIEALQAAELIITQDAYLDTETNRYADILLPGALWAEAEGVMINSERNLTLMEKAVEPPGETLPDWQIIARVACEMGFADAFTYASASEVFEEIKGAWNPRTGYDIRGASYSRLREQPLQWPCASNEALDRNPIRYLNNGVSQDLKVETDGSRPAIVFPTERGKGIFLPRPHLPPAEMPNEDFPFVLNTGRLQHQWHTLTKTGKVATLNTLNPRPFVEIHPQDAARFGIQDKDQVEVRSLRGRAVLPAVVTDRVREGNCFAPFHWNDVFGENLAINAVTHDAVDPISLQPEFKFCAVALQRVELIEHRFLPLAAPVVTAPESVADVTVLWASQTGNAEALAEQFCSRLRDGGISVELSSMADFAPGRLAKTQTLALISSTFGDGDPPDNGQGFWHALSTADTRLESLRFAVLALGDSNYDQFCRHGKQLDQRFQELGAMRLLERVDCDTEFEEPAQKWMAQLQQTLDPTRSVAPIVTATASSKDKTYPSRLLTNRHLNHRSTHKETRMFALGLADSELSYEAGDALGVWPRNCPELVAELLDLTRLHADTTVNVARLGEVPLHQALTEHYEIARPTPDTLAFIAERSRAPALKQLLGSERKAELKDWLWGRQLADVLHAFPIDCAADELLGTLKRLQPRLYSISSSAKAHPREVHLTVAAVRYGKRKGVSSTFLADRVADGDVPVFVQPSKHFRTPADGDVPMIMIGPGTGVAPFRAFLQERRARGDQGRNWLFFGEQHAATDFYYREELEGMQHDRLLTQLSLAFSRDQSQKIYVQDRIREQGAELWRWLQDGAQVYICGDASRMAKDVDQALREVAQQHGGLSQDGAVAYWRQLSEQKRYLRDVY